ncbi:MAG: flagellar hook protein FlgE [Acidiphilium sp. 37-64-53]|uniref:flagellar hook protein FlgE n=1 Tax=Acidiphilium TaxID=522 RepID=UPI000BCEBC8C|nr:MULTISPECIES: flagellar hook protein FlgE [Acidiphilium]OYW02735.1 MAG: flagellar hook protein FlgE [Acidiphilium sp. 37-64-53]OZB29307.1 MAG: flagellar hook protein FlgE [Acidiphilium sp. 34-64-41]HQT85345.1 flagellar hook protein FlgE [Acidiphilium rubrum]
MSIFGALDTSVSGMQAQSSAFTNISDNIANSQTTGYKGVDTNFINYLTQSSSTSNGADSVIARPDYSNTVAGTITQSTNPLALAISGQGYFNVSDPVSSTASSSATQNFQTQQYYTRSGDFKLNKQGYLVNGTGAYLNGWSINTTNGVVNTSSLAPIQISQATTPPIATSTVTLSASLPTTPATSPVSTQVDIYDSLGNLQQLNLSWTQTGANQWSMAAYAPGDTAGNTANTPIATASMTFGSDGTLSTLSTSSAGASASKNTAGQPATLTIPANFGNGTQNIALDFGTFGGTAGLTQYAGTGLNLQGASQNGTPPGNFSNLSIDTQGNITVNYSNGFSQAVAQIPLATFNAPDALQNQSGQLYTASQGSGAATINAVGSNGNALVTGSTESSNVDIATQFTSLITAQQAYTANSKVITTAQQLLQTTVNMVQ